MHFSCQFHRVVVVHFARLIVLPFKGLHSGGKQKRKEKINRPVCARNKAAGSEDLSPSPRGVAAAVKRT